MIYQDTSTQPTAVTFEWCYANALKMKNSLISALLFVSIQFGFGQDDGRFKPGPQFVNLLPQGQFKPWLISGDPLEQINTLDQFNSECKRIHPRGGLVFRLDSTIQRIVQGSIGSVNSKLVRHYQYGENDKTSINSTILIKPDGDTAIIIREAFLYLNNNLVSQYDLCWFDSTSGEPYYRVREHFTYNTEGLLESSTDYYSFGQALEPGDSTTYKYNAQAFPESVTEHYWDEASASWVERYKKEYTYTPFQKLLSYVISAKETVASPWVFLSKRDYTHAQGQLRTIISSIWNETAWEKSNRTVFTYDDDGHLLEQSDQIWIPEGFQWQDEYLYLYENNAEGNRISARDRRWFQDGHEWIIGDSLSYEYNLLGDTSTIWSYGWHQASNPWEWQGWGKYYYNTGIAFSSIVLRPQSYVNTLPETFHSMLTGSYLVGLGEYDLQDSVEYYYSFISATSTGSFPELTTVYPNPASDFLSLNIPGLNPGAQLRLYSSTGCLSLSTRIEPSQSVDVSQLSPGIFALQVRNGSEIYTGKVVIQR